MVHTKSFQVKFKLVYKSWELLINSNLKCSIPTKDKWKNQGPICHQRLGL